MEKRKMSDASADTDTAEGIKRKYLCEADLYQELWHGRDLEITSLWQRSVFLGTFLLITYTGYGALWLALIKESIDIITPSATNYFLNLGFISLAGFGLVMSTLWIQMAKGSKRWYERYENSISKIINNFDLENRVFSFPEQPSGFNEFPMHGNLEETKCDNSLFSTKAGKFSVSRVNIAFGQVAFIIWRLLLGLHVLLTFLQIGIGLGLSNCSYSNYVYVAVITIIGVGMTVFGIGPLIQICSVKTRSNS